MFDDLDQIDWAGLGVEQAPQWIKGLASGNSSVRNQSFDALRDSGIYERPSFAIFVVPYVLLILENNDVNPETEVLLEFLRALRQYARGFVGQNLAVESSKKIIADIDNSMDVFRRLSENPLTRDAALELISEIENK
jgi:hypothetical protein